MECSIGCVNRMECVGVGADRHLEKELDGRFNFYVVNDMGRNGYYDQNRLQRKWESWQR